MQPAIAGPGGNGLLGALLMAEDTPLEVGTLLSARVVGTQGGNVVLAMGGTRLALPATLALTLGQQVRLQVVRTASGQLGLRLVEPAGVPLAPQSPIASRALPTVLLASAAPTRGSPQPPPAAEAPAGGLAARPEPSAGAALPEWPADRPGAPAARAAASHSGAAPSRMEADPLVEEPLSQPQPAGALLAPRILPGGSEPGAAGPAGAAWAPRALPGRPLARTGPGEPARTIWRDALAVLDTLATQGAADSPATALAAETLRAWSTEALEAPALARWLGRVVREVVVPSEAKQLADSTGLAPAPRAASRPAADAHRGVAGAPEPLAGDARSRLALLRAATTDAEAAASLDRLAAQLAAEQARSALAPPGAAAWCFTLPPPRPDHPTPLECRVAELPADGSAGETPARYSVQLRLALPHLGELLVDLHTAGEQARCRLLTTSPLAAALFDATMGELAQGLARAGYPRAAVEARVRPAPPARGDSSVLAARLDVRA
ncbi:MAG TPA: flagellar hook-length control protein FliK [Chloroflexota bacterium]|nr:flagellar hook-length control protein FliK [Chloroflexota bacterium]